METNKINFSNQDLYRTIVPLFLEQLLVMLVGVADTFVVSYAGETAVSGVSLVNQFNTIFIYLFTALASGGAVVISQYIGSGDSKLADKSASQLLMFSTVFSTVLGVTVLIGNETMLRLIFGNVDADVMDACVIYLRISAYSYPFLGIYNAGASLYRSMGKTKVTMYISVVANIVNVIGNCIGVFVLKAGVAGVAYPSLIARALSAVWITALCFKTEQKVKYDVKSIFQWDGEMLKKILGIAIPNGIEQGVFQFVKVALYSIVALFGTYQIAANGVAQSIWGLAALASVAMGPIFITVIGQCMGSGDTDVAEFYFKKLLKIAVLLSIGWNAFILVLTPLIMRFYSLSAETKHLVIMLVILHNCFNSFALPFFSPLGSGLRATGDVKFTMYASIGTTVGVRLLLSYVFAIVLNLGVMGVAWAMCAEWVTRGSIFFLRLRSGKWKQFKVI